MKEDLEVIKHLLHLHACEEEGLQSGQPTTSDWYHAVNNARISIERLESRLQHSVTSEEKLKELVVKAFGEEAGEDKDIMHLYRECLKLSVEEVLNQHPIKN